MSDWRTKGEGKEHRHFKVASNKGDEDLPPQVNYDIPEEIVKKAKRLRKQKEEQEEE